MKIKMVHVLRRPPWPLWAVLIVCLWLCLDATVIFLSSYWDYPVQLCLFKRITGFACPTCGLTRGTLSLLHGHIIRAWLYNPLLFSVFGVFSGLTVVRVIFSLGIKIELTKKDRLFIWIIAIVLFFINWMYVIFFVG